MANFEEAYASQQGQTALQVQQPVVDTSTAVGLKSVANLFSGIGNDVAQGMQDRRKLEAQQKLQQREDGVVSTYGNFKVALSDAVMQGKISQSEAGSRLRAERLKYGNLYPDLAVKLDKDTAAVESGVVGQGLTEGSVEDKVNTDLDKQAMGMGMYTQSSPDAVKEQGRALLKQQQVEVNRLNMIKENAQAQSAVLSVQRAKLGIQNDLLDRQEKVARLQKQQHQESLNKNILSMGATYGGQLGLRSEQLATDLKGGKINQAAYLEGMARLKIEVNSVSDQMRKAGASAGDIDNVQASLVRQLDLHEQIGSGKLTEEAGKSHIARAQQEDQLKALNDPVMQQVGRLGSVGGDITVSNYLSQNPSAMAHIIKGSDPEEIPPIVVAKTASDKEGVKSYFDGLKGMNKDLNSKDGYFNPEQLKQGTATLNTNVNRVLSGIQAFSAAVDSPVQLNEAAEFLASDDFKSMLSTGNVKLDDKAATGAISVMESEYKDKVVPLITAEWEKAQVLVPNKSFSEAPTMANAASFSQGPVVKGAANSAITYKFTDAGVVFVAAPSAVRNASVQAQVKHLNGQTATLINRLAKMGANLEGTTVKKKLEEYEPQFFGVKEESQK